MAGINSSKIKFDKHRATLENSRDSPVVLYRFEKFFYLLFRDLGRTLGFYHQKTSHYITFLSLWFGAACFFKNFSVQSLQIALVNQLKTFSG